ncbi:MAG: tetratricopeptide repeat protein [Bacteroidales bacterium]|nr:tetratricopeptide repeat protein [Bacteroidales bacterium]
MVKKQDTVSYTVNPDPVEVYAGKMPVEIKGTFPPKYFKKKATVTFTPAIQMEDGSTVTLAPITLKGEKAEGDGKVIGYKNGGSFTVTQEIPYQPAYETSTMVGTPTAQLKTKQADLNTVALSSGVVTTADRVSCNPNLQEKNTGKTDLLLSDHNYKGPKTVEKTAAIYFELNRDNLNWSLARNKDAANKEALAAIMPFLCQYSNVEGVEITGWASPEGELKRNSELASNRSKVAERWFKGEYDKYIRAKARKEKVKPATLKKDFTVKTQDNGEDWDGFVVAVGASNIKDKGQIVNVIKSQSNPDQREQQIRNMIAMYDEIDNSILPGLRRAAIRVTCVEAPKTDEQIADYAISNPDTLNANEILYAATLTNDVKAKTEMYENAMRLYPEDFRAYNNLGCVKMSIAQKDAAKQLFEKAHSLAENEGTVLNNLGVVALLEGDTKAAAEYFEQAAANGVNSDYNLGIISMKTGDYRKAIEQMQGVKCDYNVALNYVAIKDFASAKTALDCIENKTAEDYYLLAVVGARTKDATLAVNSLKEAFKLNPDLKKRAAKDAEFNKIKDSEAFKALVF